MLQTILLDTLEAIESRDLPLLGAEDPLEPECQECLLEALNVPRRNMVPRTPREEIDHFQVVPKTIYLSVRRLQPNRRNLVQVIASCHYAKSQEHIACPIR